jgi:two-component system NtrC family sensor kinase
MMLDERTTDPWQIIAELRRERDEALEQQAATAEMLEIINSSPGDLTPVFNAMLDKALHLCESASGGLWLFEGEYFENVAHRGATKALLDARPRRDRPTSPSTAMGRILAGENVVHLTHLAEDPLYKSGDSHRRSLVDIAGARAALAVALRKDNTLLGLFATYRVEDKPYSEKQIALLQNFASQAVIAIENARLLNEIRQRQAELRVTFDNMGDGVAMFDAERRLAAWNHNFQQMLDLPDAFLKARPSFAEYFDYLAKRGEYGSAELEARLRQDIEETGRELRFEHTRPDGRVIEVRRNPVPGGGFVLIYSDVTERERAEADIRAARDAAEKALSDLKTAQASLLRAQKLSALGQLTAGIAHEIKNPLNFINNFASLSNELLGELKDTAAPALAALDADTRTNIDETIEMLSGNLDKIAEHGRRADNIVKSMLAHSRGSSGERQHIELNALVDEALNLAYHGARAHDQSFNITMERDFDRSLAPVELVPQDMMRVFLNLIGNGFHATRQRQQQGTDPGFRPVLTVTTRDLGDAVEVLIRDNGTGIRPEHRDKLFQPFFTTKPTGEGTGLGLSISYEIVTQEHGGMITVESEPDAFTEFTVRLPRPEQSQTGRSRAEQAPLADGVTGRAV